MVEAIYCHEVASVRFAIYEDGERIEADIGAFALRDVFGARGGSESLLAAYRQYAPAIGAMALEKHHAAPGARITLGTADFLSDPYTLS